MALIHEQGSSRLQISKFRIFIVWTVAFLFMAALIGRLLWIQILYPEKLIAEGNARVVRNYNYEPPRGLITDRNGRILAISVPVKTVDADPKFLHEEGVYSDKARIALGKIEGLTEKEAQKLLISNEIYSLLNNFISSENESYLKPVYDCISLKDCNYVYNAMTILKNYSVRYPLLKKVLADKASEPSVSSRLKDRLLYITK